MAATTSPTTGRRYGVAQVCRIWNVARSSFYADRRRADTTTPVPVQRRGPKPAVSDEVLVAAIRADLARSPWRRGTSQGVGQVAGDGRHPGRAQTGAAVDA
jgi:putative transposase